MHAHTTEHTTTNNNLFPKEGIITESARNVLFHPLLLYFDCYLHKDGYREATTPEDPLPTKIEETMRAGAVGRSEPGESGQEHHFSPLRGAISLNGENPSISAHTFIDHSIEPHDIAVRNLTHDVHFILEVSHHPLR